MEKQLLRQSIYICFHIFRHTDAHTQYYFSISRQNFKNKGDATVCIKMGIYWILQVAESVKNGQENTVASIKRGEALRNAAASPLHFIITRAAEGYILYCSNTMCILNSDR